MTEQRVRTRGSFTDGTQKYTRVTFGGTVTEQTLDQPSNFLVGEYQTTKDFVTPSYHSRVARGEIINNPFSSSFEARSNSYSGCKVRKLSGTSGEIATWEWSKAYSSPQLWNGATRLPPDLYGLAATQAWAGVESTSVDGATEAAEGRQTLQLFDRHQYNLRRQVEREIKYASKKGYKFPVSVPASVMANNWLLYRYGIGPAIRLLNDTLVVGSKIRTYRRTSRGFETREGQEVTTYPQQVGTFFYVDQKATLNWSASVRAGILYEYKNFNNKYGFSLSAVPEATWNVIPWSFVVDWFANTGTFISALTPRYSSDRRATWIGHELVADVLYETFLTWRNLANHQLVQAQTGAAMQRFVHRRRSPGLPAPTLAIREEALSEIKNSRRAVDAFALTWQLLQKLMRRS